MLEHNYDYYQNYPYHQIMFLLLLVLLLFYNYYYDYAITTTLSTHFLKFYPTRQRFNKKRLLVSDVYDCWAEFIVLVGLLAVVPRITL